MKLLQILDGPQTALVSEVKNQRILRELVFGECSVSQLARRIKIPEVTVWKHVQKLCAARLIEVSSVKKSANLETKLYRATAANFIPAQFMSVRPKDPRLLEAFEVYSQIQQMSLVLQMRELAIPEGVDQVDYAFYAGLKAFVHVTRDLGFQKKLDLLESKLSAYSPSVKLD